MANFLMVHGNRMVSGVQYTGISSISAHLKLAGHRFDLFDCAAYAPAPERGAGQQSRSLADSPVPLVFRPLKDGTRIPGRRDIALLTADLTERIRNTGPDVIGFSCFSDDWPFTLWLIRLIHRQFPEIPLIVGGVHATLAPQEVLRHPEIAAVCIGEGESALVELLESLGGKDLDTSVHGFWFRRGGVIQKNPRRPPLEYDDRTPFLDWNMFEDFHFIYPFEGELYRRGSVSLSRGCPYSCSFCVNDFFKSDKTVGQHRVRRKSIEYAIEELVHLKTTHHLEFLRFWDETFLALPLSYLETFGREYSDRVGLPFTIETTADSITRPKASILKEMGCRSVSIGVETSSDDQRRRLLNKRITNTQYARAFSILHDLGIRKVANFMFLLPHQTVAEMHECIRLCAEWQVESPSPRLFYPYKGTALREHCLRDGLIDTMRIEQLEDEDQVRSLDGLAAEYMTFQDTVLRIPEETKRESLLLLNNFVLLQEMPQWLHGWILDLLRHEARDRRTATIVQELRKAVFDKRYGESRG